MESYTTTLSSDDKQTSDTAFCSQYGYQEQVADPDTGQTIDNPLSQSEFAQSCVDNYIASVTQSDAINQAVSAARATVLAAPVITLTSTATVALAGIAREKGIN